jgi:hypothetical protein
MKHFEEAMKEIRPSVSPNDIKRYQDLAEAVLRRQPKRKDDVLPGYM